MMKSRTPTHRLFTSRKPDNMCRAGDIRSSAKNREDSSQPLSSRLCSTKNIQTSLPRRPEVRRAMYIKVKVKRTTYRTSIT